MSKKLMPTPKPRIWMQSKSGGKRRLSRKTKPNQTLRSLMHKNSPTQNSFRRFEKVRRGVYGLGR